MENLLILWATITTHMALPGTLIVPTKGFFSFFLIAIFEILPYISKNRVLTLDAALTLVATEDCILLFITKMVSVIIQKNKFQT